MKRLVYLIEPETTRIEKVVAITITCIRLYGIEYFHPESR